MIYSLCISRFFCMCSSISRDRKYKTNYKYIKNNVKLKHKLYYYNMRYIINFRISYI